MSLMILFLFGTGVTVPHRGLPPVMMSLDIVYISDDKIDQNSIFIYIRLPYQKQPKYIYCIFYPKHI
jgi:hypothetical protein